MNRNSRFPWDRRSPVLLALALLTLPSTAAAQSSIPPLAEPIWISAASGQLGSLPEGFAAVHIHSAQDQDLGPLGEMSGLTHLSVPCRHDEEVYLSQGAMDGILALKSLRSLDIHGQVHLSTDVFHRLGDHKELRELKLGQTGYLRGESIEQFAKKTKVERLTVYMEPGIGPGGFRAIAAIPTLKHFSFTYPSVHVSVIQLLGKNPSLRSLAFPECDELGDIEAEAIGQISKLEAVDLSMTAVTAKGVHALAALKNLKELRLGWTGDLVDDALMEFICNTWPDLEVLHIQEAQTLTDTGFDKLGTLQKLHTLNAYACPKLTDGALATLAALPALKVLDLRYSKFLDDKGLKTLAGIQSLRRLDLAGVEAISDRGAKQLKRLDNLEWLNLSECPGVGDGVTSFKREAELRWLGVSECSKVTAKTLKAFISSKSLRFLDVSGCGGVSQAAIQAFRKKSKGCHLGT